MAKKKLTIPAWVSYQGIPNNHYNVPEVMEFFVSRSKALLEISKKISRIKPDDTESWRQMKRQQKRGQKAIRIFQKAQNSERTKFRVIFNKDGYPYIQFQSKGFEEIRTASINVMGFRCDCPDSSRDFQICKHILALCTLIVALSQVTPYLLPPELLS